MYQLDSELEAGLYVVATPLGNLKDITERALQTLKSVKLIVAEDTRHSKRLLQYYGIETKLLSLHQHNERERCEEVVSRINQGKAVALISDAGTPTISDPGHLLVQAAHVAKIKVVPVPGPSAVIAALSVSGFPAGQFIFEGFLPSKSAARQQKLQSLMSETRTQVFYEAPHRIVAMLTDLRDVFGGERKALLARELTKMFETVRVTSLGDLVDWVTQDSDQQLGEFVIVVEGSQLKDSHQIDEESLEVLNILLSELPTKQAVSLASKITGKSKNDLYKIAVS